MASRRVRAAETRRQGEHQRGSRANSISAVVRVGSVGVLSLVTLVG